MTSSRITTLFAELPPSRREPSGLLVSILLHCFAIGLLYLGLRHAVRIEDQSLVQRYTVRLLNLHTPDQKVRRAAGGGVSYHAPQVANGAQPGGSAAALPAVPLQLAQRLPAPQTLVQPDLPPNLLLPHQTPIPLVLMWAAENTPVRQLVPPPIQKITAADLHSSLERPNHESKIADLKISATAFATQAPSLPPSTTSPVVVRGPEPAKQLPETSSKPLQAPTPATVMSLSDLRMPEGTVALPLANEVSPTISSGPLGPGRSDGSSQGGSGNPASKQNGTGTGQEAGNRADKEGIGGRTGQGNGGGSAGQNGASTGPSEGADSGNGSDSGPSVAHVTLPRDGQFGVVVVGSSLAEKYPEIVGLWGGRLAYTVYLHVGLPKSWILQYCLPRAAEAAAGGTVVRPDAPWPYDIVRPQLAPGDSDADAIMVHGFVNVTGRFEKLAIVFPSQFAQTKFLLSALQQWQFRPARQNGQIASVEVLLIIPEEEQ
jgi:hypothetical protein